MSSYHKYFKELQAEHGDIVRLKIPLAPPWIIVFGPELTAEMYNSDGKYIDSPGFEGFKKYRTLMRPEQFPDCSKNRFDDTFAYLVKK